MSAKRAMDIVPAHIFHASTWKKLLVSLLIPPVKTWRKACWWSFGCLGVSSWSPVVSWWFLAGLLFVLVVLAIVVVLEVLVVLVVAVVIVVMVVVVFEGLRWHFLVEAMHLTSCQP